MTGSSEDDVPVVGSPEGRKQRMKIKKSLSKSRKKYSPEIKCGHGLQCTPQNSNKRGSKECQVALLTYDDINRFHKHFSSLNKIEQDKFVLKYMTISSPERRVVNKETAKRKQTISIKYKIRNNNGQFLQVCAASFQGISGMSKDRLSLAARKYHSTGRPPKEDRGGDRTGNVDKNITAAIKENIKNYKCRESGSLPAELNIRKMWTNFCNERRNHKLPFCSLSKYKYVFYKFFNLSFRQPHRYLLDIQDGIVEDQSREGFIEEKRIQDLDNEQEMDSNIIPDDIMKEVEEATRNVIPEKSRNRYYNELSSFNAWRKKNSVSEVLNESVVLAYITSLTKDIKPSSLWTKVSMLKQILLINDNVDIYKLGKVQAFMKQQNLGYVPKKSKSLTSEQCRKFIIEAPDDELLLCKVILTFGLYGACCRDELLKLTVDNIEDRNKYVLVKLPDTKKYTSRSFVLPNSSSLSVNPYAIYRRYADLRPHNAETRRFFLGYRHGKCIVQPAGMHTIGGVPRKVAEFLGLDHPEDYTGHSLRRSGVSMFAEKCENRMPVKKYGGWKSSMAAEGFVDQSIKVLDAIWNSSSEADKQSPATATSEKNIEMVICPSVDEVKTGTTSWVSESLSEDSSHSEYPSVILDETRQGTSSSMDMASLPGTSSMNLDPLLAPSSIDNVSVKSEPIEMTPPRLTPSRSVSPGVQSTTVTQSLNTRRQNNSGETRPLADVEVSADLGSKQLDKLLLETNGIGSALDSLEVISKQVNQLDGRDDHFENFGRYVASLLRSLPSQRAVDLQQEVIKLILRSDTCQEISPVDLGSTLTLSSINVAPSTSAPDKVDTPPPPPPRPTPSRITPSIVESINVDKSLPLSQQNKRGEKRSSVDDSLCEVKTKHSKFDDLLHETEQIDAALKRLQNICNQIDQLCGRDDQFDDFGRYTASLLRRVNSKRAMELQEETINLILRSYVSASAVR